jgi:hypothetical protein
MVDTKFSLIVTFLIRCGFDLAYLNLLTVLYSFSHLSPHVYRVYPEKVLNIKLIFLAGCRSYLRFWAWTNHLHDGNTLLRLHIVFSLMARSGKEFHSEE